MSVLNILVALVADVVRMLLGLCLRLAEALARLFLRLLGWSVRRYGFARTGAWAALLVAGAWLWFRLHGAGCDRAGWIRLAWVLAISAAGVVSTEYLAARGGRLRPRAAAPAGNRRVGLRQVPAVEAFDSGQADRADTGSLWERCVSLHALRGAWEKVMRRSGAPGSDGVTVEQFAADAGRYLALLAAELQNGRYRPRPYRQVEVAKGDGGTRRLAIPCLRDRVVQTSMAGVLTPCVDGRLQPCSYAYRPGRSVLRAVAAVEAELARGMVWVVDADIRSFFDTVPHAPLWGLLRDWVPDARARWLVRVSIEAGCPAPRQGLPQGSPLSPVLSNVYLHPFDAVIVGSGSALVRYADDFLIMCATRAQAENALGTAGRVLGSLGLNLHPDKTRIVHRDEGFSFLGHRFGAQSSDAARGPLMDWAVYRERFVGRRDVFARFWRSADGRHGYVPVRRPVSGAELEAHVAGRLVLGTYLLHSGGLTPALVFDVDGPGLSPAEQARAFGPASDLVRLIQADGAFPAWFDSGGKGFHLWLCFREPVPAEGPWRVAQRWLEGLRPLPEGCQVEVFPRPARPGRAVLGSLIRLPLGQHPITGRWSRLLDPGGRPVEDPWAPLASAPLVEPAFFRGEGSSPPPAAGLPDPPAGVAALAEGCAIVRGLVAKAASSRDLRHTERLALLYVLGSLGEPGQVYLRQVIGLCRNYDARITDRWIRRLQPGHKPIRCSTLREWLRDSLPGVTCSCRLRGKSGSPLGLASPDALARGRLRARTTLTGP